MAHKLECPNCKRTLKIKGDECKEAQGTYVVCDEDDDRKIICQECDHKSKLDNF
jgi:hypothetical protein